VITQGSFFAGPLLALGTPEQKHRWLPSLAAGSRSKGITAFVVEAGDDGFARGPRLPKLGSRCFPAGELRLESCFVPEDRRLGAEGDGFRARSGFATPSSTRSGTGRATSCA
jgi:alkylation response protein AidB-like acyl-CoA dehydrogenase